MNKTKNDLPLDARTAICDLLNTRLADAIDLMLQAKQAHWNVKGPNFIALHELFDKVSEVVEEHADLIAERITALGGTAEGTAPLTRKHSTLPAWPMEISFRQDHCEALSNSLAAFAAAVRKSIDTATELKDAGTADLLTGVSRDIDKQLWFVEAHLD